MSFAIGSAQQQKAAATKISGLRMHHGERKAGCYGGVHCIAASLHDVHAGSRSQLMLAGNHAMRAVRRTHRRRHHSGCRQQQRKP